MRLKKFFFGALFSLFALSFVEASPLSVEGVARGGSVSRDWQLREIADVVRPNVVGYLSLATYFFPHPGQTALRSPFGRHDGYAFSQRFSTFFASEMGNSGWSLGLLWWIERLGWDSEDFILFPEYGDFSLVQSVQTAGLSILYNPLQFGLAGGIQYMNPEHVAREIYPAQSDSLGAWGYVFFGPFALQGAFGEGGWKMFRSMLRLEGKELYGGAYKGFTTYLPNLELTAYRDADSIRLGWEQNLYAQHLYGEAVFFLPDYGFYSASLKFYPDPSRLIAFEASCFREPDGDLTFGGAINFLMFRIAYNHVSDFEHLFGSKGTFVFELNFNLGATPTTFFGKNAAKSAPMETSSKIIHEQGSTYKKPEEPAARSIPRDRSEKNPDRMNPREGAL